MQNTAKRCLACDREIEAFEAIANARDYCNDMCQRQLRDVLERIRQSFLKYESLSHEMNPFRAALHFTERDVLQRSGVTNRTKIGSSEELVGD